MSLLSFAHSSARWAFLLAVGSLMGAAMFGGVAFLDLSATDIRPIQIALFTLVGGVLGVPCALAFGLMLWVAEFLADRIWS